MLAQGLQVVPSK